MTRRKRGDSKKDRKNKEKDKEDQSTKTTQEQKNTTATHRKRKNDFEENTACKENQTTLEKDRELTQLKLQVQATRERKKMKETAQKSKNFGSKKSATQGIRKDLNLNHTRETRQLDIEKENAEPDTDREAAQADREREATQPDTERDTSQPETERDATQSEREKGAGQPGTNRDTTQPYTEREATQTGREQEATQPDTERDTLQPEIERDATQSEREKGAGQPGTNRDTTPPYTEREATQTGREKEATQPDTERDTLQPDTEREATQPEREKGEIQHDTERDTTEPDIEQEATQVNEEQEENILDDNTFFFNNVFGENYEETETTRNETCSTHERQEGRYFHFLIQPDMWNDIKPIYKIYKSGRQVSKLKGNWTQVLSENVSEFENGCVLSFEWHNIKSSNSNREFTPYLNAKAHCKGNQCNGVFTFTIQNEPNDNEPALVDCYITGCISHDSYEVNRRPVTGLTRERLGEEIKKDSPAKVYYEHLLNSNKEQMSLGNYTSVPNPAVLRKIVSEQMRKENLHQNIIAELQVLKESNEKENMPYIRDIGLDPFCVIMFSDDQINFLKKNADDGFVDLYIDATGSVVQNIPDQKRPYLYTIVVKPKGDLPGVSIADMISTQHTIPRIELFLATTKRAMYLTGRNSIKVRKIETDFSFPLIQACLHTFNNTSLKAYLVKCSNIINTGQIPNDMYVHHLCSSHMLNDFSRTMKKYKHVVKKPVRYFSLKSFAILQNTTTLEEAQRVFKDVCIVFLNQYNNGNVEHAKRSLRAQSRMEEEFDIESDEFMGRSLEELKEEDVFDKTIKAASPFTIPFQEIAGEVTEMLLASQEQEKADINELYCSEVVECLVQKFMPILPLWSGLLLSKVKFTDEDITTRDSSAVIESWFKFIKNDIGLRGNLRPYKFIISNKKAINGRLIEHEFPGCRKKSSTNQSTKRKKESDADINTKEEIWKKKKKPARYHNIPSSRKIPKPTGKPDEQMKYPKVMRWGGKIQDTNLHNTCTIDNALTILYLHSMENLGFREDVHSQNEELFKTLSTVFRLMDEQEYAAAKIVWLQHANVNVQPSTNLFGDEADLFVRYFDTMWKSYTRSNCDLESCPKRILTSREEQGVTIQTPKQVNNVQELVDTWMVNTSACNSVEDVRLTSGDDNDANISQRCSGTRRAVRHLRKISPVLIIRVYEHAVQNRISLKSMLSSGRVTVQGHVYQRAGVTMHRHSHYCAIVESAEHGALWYDGLAGKLQPLPSSVEEWNPYYIYFCRGQ